MDIFNIIRKPNLNKDFENLYNLFAVKTFEELGYNRKMDDYFTIEEYINYNYFLNWQNHGTYNDLIDLENDICPEGMSFDDIVSFKPIEYTEDVFFCFIELLYNLLCPNQYDNLIMKNELPSFCLKEGHPFAYLLKTLKNIREKYGLEICPVEDRLYINKIGFEKADEIITDADIASEIYKYRSPSIKGNLIEKQKILCILGTYIDKFRESGKLEEFRKDATFLLNKFEIRHSIDKKAADLIISDDEKENIYDLTFNRILKYLSYKDYSKEDEHFNEIKDKFK